ncbi:hypothetical protein WN943_005679 [Citrus x changshan-huyou]
MGGNGLAVGFCDVCKIRASCCFSLAAVVELDVKGGIDWKGVVDVGGVELGRSMASTAAAMVAVRFEMKSTQLEVSAVVANVVSGN